MVNSPLFTNAGDFQATIATGNSNFDAQTSVANTDNVGIMLNGSYGNETNDSTDDFHKHIFIEGGVGYSENISELGRFEIYGGYGFGEVKGYFKNSFVEELSDARYNRFFIQPGVGISTGIFDGIFSPRFAIVQMNPVSNNFISGEYGVYFEPVITSKIGYKYIKFIAQFGILAFLGDQALKYDHQFFIFNFGLNLNIGRKYFD